MKRYPKEDLPGPERRTGLMRSTQPTAGISSRLKRSLEGVTSKRNEHVADGDHSSSHRGLPLNEELNIWAEKHAVQKTCSPLCDCERSNNPHRQATHPYQKTHKANCILPSLKAPHQGDVHAHDIFQSSWRNTDCRDNGSDGRCRRAPRTQGTRNGDPAIPQQQCLRRTP